MFIRTKSKRIFFFVKFFNFFSYTLCIFYHHFSTFCSPIFQINIHNINMLNLAFFFNGPGPYLRTFQNDVITIRYEQFICAFFGDSIYLLRNQTPPIVLCIIIYCRYILRTYLYNTAFFLHTG